MSTKIKFLSEWTKETKNAGSKARYDVEIILRKNFPQFARIIQINSKSKLIKIQKFLTPHSLRLFLQLCFKHHVTVIMQYPFRYNPLYVKFLIPFAKKNHPVLFVHDINSIRDGKNVKDEIEIINRASAVILHNFKMESFLRKNGLKIPVVNLELFDYLLERIPDNKEKRIHYGYEIVFAGNLAKSQFLLLLGDNSLGLKWNLYGNGFPDSLSERNWIKWKGSYGANDIPFKLEGSFGLVWDGKSFDGCTGPMGNYLRYNNPHKLSLYIASGIPIVTWSQAAIADFVEKYNVGIVVDGLEDIRKKIDELSKDEYELMRKNVTKIQPKVVKGEFTQKALNAVRKIIDKDGIYENKG